jgi:hypothetical protein
MTMARPSYSPDPPIKGQVEAMAAYGIPEDDIAAVLKVDAKTLRKHFRDELDLGHTKANAQVAGFLFNSAKTGNVTAQIFWLKTRARWREVPVELKHSGSIERTDLSQMSDEELMSRIIALDAQIGFTRNATLEGTLITAPDHALRPVSLPINGHASHDRERQ